MTDEYQTKYRRCLGTDQQCEAQQMHARGWSPIDIASHCRVSLSELQAVMGWPQWQPEPPSDGCPSIGGE
jgi:hypothetical protein